jgi:hypothetical protein
MWTIWAAICKMSSICAVSGVCEPFCVGGTKLLRHLLAGTRNMPSQKGKRAKGDQMTEQQPKTVRYQASVSRFVSVDSVRYLQLVASLRYQLSAGF